MPHDPVTGHLIPFNLTKRRREVLYWMAYGPAHGVELTVQRIEPFWRGYSGGSITKISLMGVDVTGIATELRRAKFIRAWFAHGNLSPRITPLGMAALLEGPQ